MKSDTVQRNNNTVTDDINMVDILPETGANSTYDSGTLLKITALNSWYLKGPPVRIACESSKR